MGGSPKIYGLFSSSCCLAFPLSLTFVSFIMLCLGVDLCKFIWWPVSFMNLISKSLLSLGTFSAVTSFDKLSAPYSFSKSSHLQTGSFTGMPQSMRACRFFLTPFPCFSSGGMASTGLSLSPHALSSAWPRLMLALQLSISCLGLACSFLLFIGCLILLLNCVSDSLVFLICVLLYLWAPFQQVFWMICWAILYLLCLGLVTGGLLYSFGGVMLPWFLCRL